VRHFVKQSKENDIKAFTSAGQSNYRLPGVVVQKKGGTVELASRECFDVDETYSDGSKFTRKLCEIFWDRDRFP
jgi:hypothetical protein